MPRRRRPLALLALLAGALVPASAAHAGLPVYVLDGAERTVYVVDSATGARTPLAVAGKLQQPTAIALEASGDLVVADRGAAALVRIHRRTGTQTFASTDPLLDEPTGVAVRSDGVLVVSDAGEEPPVYTTGAVLHVDPVSGAATKHTADGRLVDPAAIAIESTGNYAVSTPDEPPPNGALTRVNRTTGNQTSLAQGTLFADPTGLAREQTGTYLVADASGAADGRIIRVTTGGGQSLAAGGAPLADPRAIAIERSGRALVADPGADALLRVDPAAATVVPVGAPFTDPVAVAIPPDEDDDGAADLDDTCPGTPNPAQTDTDLDGRGDACDDDDDGDGLADDAERRNGTDPLDADTDGDGTDDRRDVCPLVLDVAQADGDGDGTGDACEAPRDTARPAGGGGAPAAFDPAATPGLTAPAPEPVLGRAVAAARRSGTVTVRRPGSRVEVPLDGGSIPVGAVVDTTQGAITLTTALPDGTVQSARFSGGRFTVTQQRDGVTDLRLRGAAPACARRRAPTARAAGRTPPKKPRRPRLWGDGHGRFRTHGRDAVATVRGTRWLVEEACRGTVVRVARGVVGVRDKRTGRTTLVRRGGRYLARHRR